MDAFLQDVRYALRTLRKSPAFTAIAVLCLALGIGVNTTMFSVTNGVILKPYPFTDSDRIAVVRMKHVKNDWDSGVSYLNFLDWRQQSTSFSQMAAHGERSIAITDGEEPERLQAGMVSWDLFPMLGIAPYLGRQIREDEDRAGGEPVLLLGHDLWTRRYNTDSSIVGKPIRINGNAYTVIGVMPPKFKFPENDDLWMPIAPLASKDQRGWRYYGLFGRLAPTADIVRARTELAAISKRLQEQYAIENDKDWVGDAVALREEFLPDDVKLVILTMMGAVTFVLLIACANVANLMLARATGRARELAVRAALGAGRGRIVRQLLTEAVLLGLTAGAIGIPLAFVGTKLIYRAMPPGDVPYYIDWSIDRETLIYTVVVSLVTGLVFGLAPALQAARGSIQGILRDGGRGMVGGGSRNRVRNSLVVVEVALSLVLLIGASLFVRSFVQLQHRTGGFDSAPIMTMRMYLPGTPYDSLPARSQRIDEIVRRVAGLPGVQAATASALIPLSGGGAGDGIVVEGRDVVKGEEPFIRWSGVTADWLETLGVSLVSGRTFTAGEAADSSRVAVVNQNMAAKQWPGADAIGQRFRLSSDTTNSWFTVIGVARDFQHEQVSDREEDQGKAYLPYPYLPGRNVGLMIRTPGNPASITSALRREIRAVDPNIPLFEIMTMDEVRRLGFWQYGLFGWMFSIFGAIALLLAAIGVYGVISYGVSQRTQEIGVRVALGARGADVLRLIVGQGLRLAGIGIGIGLLGAFGITRVVQSLLIDVSPTDPASFVGVSTFLIAVAMVASWVPARRATGVDPIVALRNE